MTSQNYLGIYISKNTATVVCLDSQGRDGNILGCFSASVDEQDQASSPGTSALASLIAQGCAERELKFSEVAVALDCAIFMQHSVHSEFNDLKQIAATVRFDAEEALATDISDVALAFEINSSDKAGSELTVFTAQRKMLSDVLFSLQQYNLDPVTIEPDVTCLSRFICQRVSSTESQEVRTLFGMLSRRRGYLIVPPAATGDRHDPAPQRGAAGAGSKQASIVRTFLVNPRQGRGELLTREVLVTAALTASLGPINRIKVFDSAGSINYEQLGKKLGIEAEEIDWLEAAGIETQTLANCAGPAAPGRTVPAYGGPVDFAIAYGAALAHFEKGRGLNFRDDFSPFQGKKLRLQKTLKYLSISVTILLIAIGLYFQTRVFSENGDRSDLRDRFAKAYSAVMSGQELSDKTKTRDAVRKLGGLLRRIESERKGLITDEESVSSKLTLVFKAFNKCAAQTNLNLKSVSITARDISIAGDTSNRRNTLTVFDTVRKSGLVISKEIVAAKGARDTFSITVALKK
ncbi:MAG: type II secretion system protein GspL [Planctomycetota bacterium]